MTQELTELQKPSITPEQSLDALEILRDHIPMAWRETEAAIKLLQQFIEQSKTVL